MRIFSQVIQGLGSALDLYEARHRVLAENVANAETPGYRARDLDFDSALAEAFAPTSATAGPSAQAQAVEDRHAIVKIDRNSVDLDVEMSRLSENAFRMRALTEILARKYAGLKRAIEGGPR